MDNVVATFHTAGVSHEGRRNVAAIAAEQIVAAMKGGRPPRLINPEVCPPTPRGSSAFSDTQFSIRSGHLSKARITSEERMSKTEAVKGIVRKLGWAMSLSLGLLHHVHAAYPDKPITLIIAFAPGGGTDLTARAIAPFIEKYLGNNAKFIVLNKTGAGGAIGFAQLASSPPDGYTIGMINTPNMLTIPIERKAEFSWQRYDLLGNLVDDPGNFAVHTDSPIKNLAELAALAKSKPGDVSVGTTGAGSDDHLAMLLFEKATGAKMNHIPFKGAADVRTAIAGKQITVAAMNVGEAMQALKGGTPIRNLGSMSSARTSLAPIFPPSRNRDSISS